MKDANRIRRIADRSQDERFIIAFNRVKDLVVHRRDFNQVDYGAVAFTVYQDNINFSVDKYFQRDTYHRAHRFVHEVFHHDTELNSLSRNRGDCESWDVLSSSK